MSPDGSTKPLPEEKLLKLIRDKGPGVVAPAAVLARGAAANVRVASDAKVGLPRLRWPTLIAGGLAVVLLVEATYLIIQLVRPVPNVTIPVVANPPPVEPAGASTMPPETASLALSASPTLFVAPTAHTTSFPSPGDSPGHGGPSEAVKLLAARLTLMGIVAGEPAQAIIQDSQNQKTYFVTPGQAVAEGATLEKVLDNHVILDLGGEKIELTL